MRAWSVSPGFGAGAAAVFAGLFGLLELLAAAPRLGPAGAGDWAVAGHALVFAAAAALLVIAGGKGRRWTLVPAGLTALCGVAVWLPRAGQLREAAFTLHLLAGAVWVIAAAALLQLAPSEGRSRWAWCALAPAAAGLLLAIPHTTAAHRPRTVSYDQAAAFAFLTATTAEQAGSPNFPSALQIRGTPAEGCTRAGCHDGARAVSSGDPHARTAANPAYRATYRDFLHRRGPEAARWCQGCHEPRRLFPPPANAGMGEWEKGGVGEPSLDTGVYCAVCHQGKPVGLYGSAGLIVGGGSSDHGAGSLRLRPVTHARETSGVGFLRSPELCAACHRKQWSLPQNGYHWMRGPDEYGEWLAGPYSGSALFAPGVRRPAADCVSCHPAHGARKPAALRMLALDAFVRWAQAGQERVEPLDSAPPLPSGASAFLDLVVRNSGIGHDFPTGMPDQQESWLDVQVLDPRGRPLLQSGVSTAAPPHLYRLVALDSAGEPVRRGDLDRMASAGEWRRIPAGAADLARYRLVPPTGAARVRVRVLSRRRSDFSAWIGEAQKKPEVLAELEVPLPATPARRDAGTQRLEAADGRRASDQSDPSDRSGTAEHPIPTAQYPTPNAQRPTPNAHRPTPDRWRHYGMALAAARVYPAAIQALNRALEISKRDAETRLALGRVYLEERDLLAARDQFMRARPGAEDRSRAWEAATLRLMGQSEEALSLLRPLAGRYPRDPRVHFELGRAYRDLHRFEEAAAEFQRMLDLDPLDVSAHYNRMLSLQRLNRLPEARQEEAIYSLMRADEGAPQSHKRAWLEDQPLHVHALAPAR